MTEKLMTDEEFATKLAEIDAAYENDEIDYDGCQARKRQIRIARGPVIFIAMDEAGDYGIGATKDAAIEDIDGYPPLVRVIRRRFIMKPPAVESGDDIVIGDAEGETTVVEEAAE